MGIQVFAIANRGRIKKGDSKKCSRYEDFLASIAKRNHKCQQYACNCSMNPRIQHEIPHGNAQLNNKKGCTFRLLRMNKPPIMAKAINKFIKAIVCIKNCNN
jgi:hypothetical protein